MWAPLGRDSNAAGRGGAAGEVASLILIDRVAAVVNERYPANLRLKTD